MNTALLARIRKQALQLYDTRYDVEDLAHDYIDQADVDRKLASRQAIQKAGSLQEILSIMQADDRSCADAFSMLMRAVEPGINADRFCHRRDWAT